MSNKQWAGLTHVGLTREQNEDAFFFSADLGVAIVADGMGGHESGEVASGIAVRTFEDEIRENHTVVDASVLESVLKIANLKIHSEPAVDFYKRMGTTAVALAFHEDEVHIAWAGDSRAYHYAPSIGLVSLSKDHSIVQTLIDQGRITEEEARVHPNRNVILEVLGSSTELMPDSIKAKVGPGSTILLCSDGLNGYVEDSEIERILRNNKNPIDAAEELVQAALNGGGGDNVTVVVVTIE